MDRRWAIGFVVVTTVAALLRWLFSRNSRTTDAGALAHAPANLTKRKLASAERGPRAAQQPLGDAGSPQEHVADAMYEEEVPETATDEDMVVEETMPDSPAGTTTSQGAGAEEPPPAEVEDAAAEQSPPTAEPLYDETEWLGYAGEAVIEPTVAAENGDEPDRRRG